MLTVHRIKAVHHLLHPTRPRRYTFVDLGDGTVRVTRCAPGDRRQEELSRERARARWRFLRKLGYVRWEDAR